MPHVSQSADVTACGPLLCSRHERSPMSAQRNRRSSATEIVDAVSLEMDHAEERRRLLMRAVTIGIGVMVVAGVALAGLGVSRAKASAARQAEAAASRRANARAAEVSAATPTEPEPPARAPAAKKPEPAAQSATAPEPTNAKPAVVPKKVAPAKKPVAAVQNLRIAIGGAGYVPDALTAKAGVPIELTVGKGEGCAAGFVMPDLGIELDNSAGPVTGRLGVLKPGDYRFACAMDMVSGVLHVR